MVVVCLGEALIDLVCPSDATLRTSATLDIRPGGAPLNVAVGLFRLGVPVRFNGCLSNDQFGQRLSDVIASAGIERQPAGFVDSPTRLAVIDQSDDSAPFRFYGDDPADTNLGIDDVVSSLKAPDVTGIYLSSLMMSTDAGNELQDAALDIATVQGLAIYVDPNPRPPAWRSTAEMEDATSRLLTRCSFGKLSLDDARILGWPETPDELLQFCQSTFDAEIVVTGGQRGIWSSIDGKTAFIAPFDVDSVDPTGAGDASFAGLISAIRTSSRITREALTVAAAAGALATTKSGAMSGLPTRQELDDFLSHTQKEAGPR